MAARRGLFLFFLFFLFFPYGILLTKIQLVSAFDIGEFWWAFKNSIWQALFSAVGSFVLGIWLALGIFKVQRWNSMKPWMVRVFEALLLLPSFLPPLFILLVLLSLVQPFPTGLIGVILIHVFMNAGLVALLLKSLIESKMGPLVESSFIEGSSQFNFLRSASGMVKRDCFGIFLFVFILCFTSFSVPLIAGGGKSTTLEILIYEKIRISGAWGEALSLSFLQMSFVMVLSLLPLQARTHLFGRSKKLPLLGSRTGVAILFLYCFGLLFYFFVQSYSGWSQVFRIQGLWNVAVQVLPFSLGFGIAVGCTVGALLLLSAWAFPYEKLHRLISGMVSPSTALLGFSLLFFVPNQSPWIEAKWILGFSYLIFSTLYRWGWDQALSGLYNQVQVAETLGASRNQIFMEILLPQLLKPATMAASVAGLWALGDFALGKILVARDASLSLLIETLMSSYRLQAALALMSLLFLLGILCALFFWGIFYVARRTLEQRL